MKSKGVIVSRTAAVALMVGLLSAPAYAGFEWNPPPAASTVSTSANVGPAVPAAPPAGVDKTELMPIPGTSEAPMMTEEVAPPPPVVSDVPQIEREITAAPKVAKATDLPEVPAYSGPFAIAQGFGTDIPLALALGQIVPSEFAYSFASNVNPGLKISWDGGKPWNEVLNGALKPHNLRADIIGTVVMVRSGADSSALSAPAPQPADEDHSSLTLTPRPPADAPVVPVVASSEHKGGEGTANYPRRTPPNKGFFGSIFTPEEAKGNQAPRPPVDGKVMIENVEPESLSMNSAGDSALQAASVAPAAPAATSSMPSSMPTPLNTQKISYADETMRDSSEGILPERDVSQNVVAAPKVTLDTEKVSMWQAESNRNLQEVLSEWSQKAGVELIWDSGYNYKLPMSVNVEGTFAEAVNKVFGLYGTAEPRPQGKLHPNLPKGPSVLLVENYP